MRIIANYDILKMKILFLTNRLPHADVVGGHRLIYQRMEQLKIAAIGLALPHWSWMKIVNTSQLQSKFDFAEAVPQKSILYPPPF